MLGSKISQSKLHIQNYIVSFVAYCTIQKLGKYIYCMLYDNVLLNLIFSLLVFECCNYFLFPNVLIVNSFYNV